MSRVLLKGVAVYWCYYYFRSWKAKSSRFEPKWLEFFLQQSQNTHDFSIHCAALVAFATWDEFLFKLKVLIPEAFPGRSSIAAATQSPCCRRTVKLTAIDSSYQQDISFTGTNALGLLLCLLGRVTGIIISRWCCDCEARWKVRRWE